MAAAQIPNEKIGNPKANRRRRKKRRTEDFSSDSDSSSSSSSSSDEETPTQDIIPQKSKTIAPSKQAPNIDDIDIDSEDESGNVQDGQDQDGPHRSQYRKEDELLSHETQQHIHKIKFTSTLDTNDNKSAEQIKSRVAKEKSQLDNEFLGLMASNFADDLDELRKKPDFTDKSLVMLAKVLQSGRTIFDEEAVDALISG